MNKIPKLLLSNRYFFRQKFKSPVTDKDEKVFYPFGCLCCCPSSPLEVSALAPVRGYTPGQIINLKINVSNTSNEPLHRFEVDLIKVRE